MVALAILSSSLVSAYTPDETLHWLDCPRFDDAITEAPQSAFEKPDVLTGFSSTIHSMMRSNFGWLAGMWSAESKLPISFAAKSTVDDTITVNGKRASINDMVMDALTADYSTAREGQSLEDQELQSAFQWIDRLVVPFSRSWATKFKIKAFNAVMENKRENVRSIARMAHEMSPAADAGKNDDGDQKVFGAIQCAKVRVPLRWDDPAYDQGILFHVKRYLVPDPSKRKGILWLIQGGPGADGSVFNRLAESFMKAFNNQYDLYVEDHRGVGRSTILDCQGKSLENREVCYAEVKEQWGIKGLHGFTTSGAARDILHVSRLIKQSEHGQIALYGGSYGTYVVNRILTIDKGETIDLAVADGLARPGLNFFQWDEGQDRTGKRLLAKCVESRFCREKLGISSQSELESKMMEMYIKQDKSEKFCGLEETLPKVGLMRLLSLFLQMGAARDFIAPLVYRSLRCNEADKIALDNFAYSLGATIKDMNYPVENVDDEAFTNSKLNILDHELRKAVQHEVSKSFVTDRAPYPWNPNTEPSYSFAYELMFNIKASEFTGGPNWPERSSLVDLYYKEGRLFGVGAGVSEYDSVFPRIKGPETYDDPLASQWATGYKGPLLMMSGDLDPQTTLKDALYWQEKYQNSATYPNHYFTVFNGTHHIQTLNAITKDQKSSCGLTVMASFLTNDGKTVDTSCMTENMFGEYPFDRTSSTDLMTIFSEDFWDGKPVHFRYIFNLIINIIIVVSVLAVVCCLGTCATIVAVAICCACCTCGICFRGRNKYSQVQEYGSHQYPTPQYYQNY